MKSSPEPLAGRKPPSPAGPQWYACKVMSRAEKSVARHLEERGFESFLPLMTVRSQWRDRVKLVTLPLFRGYLFARFPLEHYGSVLRVPRLATVVRLNDAPAVIGEEEIENIRQFERRLASGTVEPEPVHDYVAGDRVRILAAPFSGKVEGVVLDLRPGKEVDVFVGIQLIGQFVRIKLSADDLEPIDPGR